MDIKTRETYSEVYSILNMLGETYIIKIPSKLYQMIKEEKLNEYNPKYDSTLALEQPNIKNETLSMIALFHLNYWCDSQEEKQELKDLFNENEINKDSYEFSLNKIEKKSAFASGLLYFDEEDEGISWKVPHYIKEGLLWIQGF